MQPSNLNPQGWLRRPEDVIFAKQSLPCESKNHNIAVFAPGNLRKDFSKTVFLLPIRLRIVVLSKIDYSTTKTNRSQ